MEIRVLTEADASACRLLRLEGLRDYPTAFASSYDEEREIAVGTVAERLGPTENGVVFGAFDGESLIGMVGIERERRSKLRHKALIWGMYVTPTCRRTGVGNRLLQSVLDYAATRMPGLKQINLCVNTSNTPAIEMYRRAGFEPFGVERAFLIVDDDPQDLIHMVRLIRITRN
jgi:ribosomal protein S18 acetylase RimI-like enzyme